jgi:N-acetyltransferase
MTTPNPFSAPITLSNAAATLVPLSPDHLSDLQEATQDGDLNQLWFTAVPSAQGMANEIERRQSLQRAGTMNPFAIISNMPGALQGKAVGMTTFMNIDAPNRHVEIGSTWYRAAVQRTALNTSCKRLLLAHAFDTLDCIAVEFRTHFMNHASRRGIERLGAVHGTTLRDTCVYSITCDEWPTVRAHLDFQISKPR